MTRIVGLILGLTAFVACSNQSSPTAPSAFDTGGVPTAAAGQAGTVTTAASAAPDPAAANYEVKFMTGMIDHHQMAIEMARLCLTRAVHDELRQLCESIIAAQSREIRQMQGWLQDWYSLTYSPQMSGAARKDMQRLSAASGAEFEIMFMEMMIRHHEAAVKEAQTCLERAYHRQLLRLCESIIAAQSAEIALMEQWLCEWYGRCSR